MAEITLIMCARYPTCYKNINLHFGQPRSQGEERAVPPRKSRVPPPIWRCSLIRTTTLGYVNVFRENSALSPASFQSC